MIRPLRARHRLIFATLLIALPAGITVALSIPRPMLPDSLPAELVHSVPAAPGAYGQIATFSPLSLKVRCGRTASGERLVELWEWNEPTLADVLLYWAPSEPRDGTLPVDAAFVGSLGPQFTVLLPEGAGGWLVVYALADSELLGALELED